MVVMRQSPSTEIRELIIRCMSQMVQARVGNIKAGRCRSTLSNPRRKRLDLVS